MPRRFVQSRDRLTFVAIGAWALFLGVTLLWDHTIDSGVWLADLWPLMLLIGGVLTVVFSVRLSSFRLRGLSNALLVVACVGRGSSAALGLINGQLESVPRKLAEMAVFTMIGYLLYITWKARIPTDHRLID